MLKKKNDLITSIDAENAFNKFQCSFIIKTLSERGVKWNLLNLTKSIYKDLQPAPY